MTYFNNCLTNTPRIATSIQLDLKAGALCSHVRTVAFGHHGPVILDSKVPDIAHRLKKMTVCVDVSMHQDVCVGVFVGVGKSL